LYRPTPIGFSRDEGQTAMIGRSRRLRDDEASGKGIGGQLVHRFIAEDQVQADWVDKYRMP
jgi:hypothetical protein